MKQTVLSAAAMQAADAYSIHKCGIGALELMEEAAQAVADEIEDEKRNILILTGAGNNGADGLAAARLLMERAKKNGSGTGDGGLTVTAALCVDADRARFTEEYLVQRERICGMPVRFLSAAELYRELEAAEADMADGAAEVCRPRYDCIIDAVFGIGLHRPVTGETAELFMLLNRLREQWGPAVTVVAVDAPSGVSCENGQVLGCALRADRTVTFGWNKIGLLLYPGAAYAGDVRVRHIGFAGDALDYVRREKKGAYAYTITGDASLPKRRPYSNKGSYGKLLVIAGSANMAGAAYFCAAAAYASGVGLVRVFTPEENRQVMQTLLPEAVLAVYRDDNAAALLARELEWADHIVIGPGLGTGKTAWRITEYVAQRRRVPALWDADALNLLAAHRECLALLRGEDVLTPHPAELARLLGCSAGEVTADHISAGRRLQAMTGAVCVCKEARTLVFGAQEEFYINTSGNSGMATAGMGDVLAGIIGGFLAGGMSAWESAVNGVYLHGKIGDAGSLAYSEYALTAGKMIRVYREVLSGGPPES